MLSTHMACGFVSAYVLAQLFAWSFTPSYPAVVSVSVWFVLAGLVGGFIPDIDAFESKGFVHRKTLHYIFGYLIAAILLAILVLVPLYLGSSHQIWVAAFVCVPVGAWIHSVMDLADGGRNNDLSQGVYEHVIWKRWLPANNRIPFADWQEWSLQAFAALCFIPISATLPQLDLVIVAVPGWVLGTGAYALIWIVSTWYDLHHQVQVMKRT